MKCNCVFTSTEEERLNMPQLVTRIGTFHLFLRSVCIPMLTWQNFLAITTNIGLMHPCDSAIPHPGVDLLSYFSHCHDPQEAVNGRRAAFGLQFKGVQSIVVEKAGVWSREMTGSGTWLGNLKPRPQWPTSSFNSPPPKSSKQGHQLVTKSSNTQLYREHFTLSHKSQQDRFTCSTNNTWYILGIWCVLGSFCLLVICFLSVCASACAGACGGQERVSGFLELRLQVVVSFSVWCREPNSGPLQKLQVLLTAESCPQPATGS